MNRIQRAPWCGPRPKENALRDEGYRRWVASLDCIHCGSPGPCQAAHADQGKGKSIKADDRRIFPLCAAKPMRRGCHDIFGDTGTFRQEHRRQLEDRYVRITQERAIEEGAWPKRWPLPDWAREAA
jgi:hypothetical protein